MTFYDRFKFLCEEKGVSPTQAARENGVTQQAASHWKKRGSMPKSETLWKFVSYFDTNIDFLLGKKGAPVRTIQTLGGKTIPYREKSFVSDYQEFYAIESYLDEMGYKISRELSIDGPVDQWTLYDKRTQQGYFLSGDKVAKLTNAITAFANYQIHELIREITKAPRYRRQDPAQPPAEATPAQAPAAQDAPEGDEKPE